MKINVIYNIGTSLLIVMSSILFSVALKGQTEGLPKEIRSTLLIGSNFSQLDGDRLSGFDKLGIRAGMNIAFPLTTKRAGSISLLYDQKGSSSSLFNTGFRQYIALDYISLPLSMHWYSWWYDELKGYKINIYGSLVPSRLITTRSNQQNFDNATDRFKKWDISLALGVGYLVGRHSSIHLRIERSLLKIYEVPNATISGLQSYLVTVQFAYLLNKVL